MPYIKQKDRQILEITDMPVNSGELNYLITKMLNSYVSTKGLCYTTINDVIGVLACASAEFYRRIAAPYEDEKNKANGDVYG